MLKTMIHSFDVRLRAWLERMESAPPCSNQQTAFNLVISEWIEANLSLGVPERFLHRLRGAEFTEERGWKGIGTKVAYWDIEDFQIIRIYLHDDGAIVLQRLEGPRKEILLTRPGLRSVRSGNGKSVRSYF